MRRDNRSKQGGKKRVGRGVKSKRLPLLSAKREVFTSVAQISCTACHSTAALLQTATSILSFIDHSCRRVI